jgi:hypothetical protein
MRQRDLCVLLSELLAYKKTERPYSLPLLGTIRDFSIRTNLGHFDESRSRADRSHDTCI